MLKVENKTWKGTFELLDDMQHSTDYNKAYKLSFDSIPDCLKRFRELIDLSYLDKQLLSFHYFPFFSGFKEWQINIMEINLKGICHVIC